MTLLGLHDVPRFMSEPGASPARLAAAFTFLLTARGTPLVYYGDEIAMAGGETPTTAATSRLRRRPAERLEAAGRTPDEEAVFARVRSLPS
ncbi:MAG: alpha-amylase family glycosyl hydrolase [Vicinamibacteria bacterium]